MNLMILPDSSDGPIYDFAAPIGMHWSGVDSGLMLELLRTRALTRLRNVSFLGGIDYLIVRNPNGSRGNRRYTRYQHSLGVARLANFYCSLVGVNEAGRNLACVAALLHDIGHAPLSHSLEPVFRSTFGIDHHQASQLIITGNSPFGVEVLNVLRRYKIDPDHVVATIEGQTDAFDGFFSGPINFDTIEGILRSRSYNVHDRKMSSPELIVEAAALRRSSKDRAVVDKFWGFKDQTYRTVINSRQGVLADTICQMFLSKNIDRFNKESYYLTEEKFFRKLPKLRTLLTSKDFEVEVAAIVGSPIEYKSRRFFIDEKASFEGRDDSRRYGQTKIPRTLVVGTPADVEIYNGTWDMFSNDGD